MQDSFLNFSTKLSMRMKYFSLSSFKLRTLIFLKSNKRTDIWYSFNMHWALFSSVSDKSFHWITRIFFPWTIKKHHMQLLFNVVMNCFFFFLFLNSPQKHKDTSNCLLGAVCTCSFSICKLSNISYSIHCLASCVVFFFGSFVNNFWKICPKMHLQTAWNIY